MAASVTTDDDHLVILGEFLKEGQTNAQKIQFFFKNLKASKILREQIHVLATEAPACHKNELDAQKNRTRGVSLFVKKNDASKGKRLDESLKCFNAALRNSSFTSESDRTEISKLFANRSAVFYDQGRFQSALRDIEFAFSFGYPFRYKIWVRKAKIFAELGKFKEAITILKEARASGQIPEAELEKVLAVEILALERLEDSAPNDLQIAPKINKNPFVHNPSFQSASGKLSLRYETERTRYVIAQLDIHPGEVLFDEFPYASVLIPEVLLDYCYHCHAYLSDWIFPCKSCAEVSFCSESCAIDAWLQYHQVECCQTSLLRKVGLCELATRIVLRAGVNQVLATVNYFIQKRIQTKDSIVCFQHQDGDSEMYDYHRLYSLVEHSKEMDPLDLYLYAKTAAAVTCWLKENTEFFKGRTENEVFTVGGALLHHISQLISNAQRVYAFRRNADDEIIDYDRVVIGSGIYVSTSLMNHSCEPNISTNYKFDRGEGRRLIVKATRKIKSGAEVFNSYGMTYSRYDFVKRFESISEQYFFVCTCNHCIREKSSNRSFIEKFESFYCPRTKCRQPIYILPSNTTEIIMCNSCKSEINTTEIQQRFEEFKKLGEMENEKTPELLLKHLDKLRKFLAPQHRLIAEAHDELAKSYLHFGLPTKALPPLKFSVDYVRSRYGSHSNEYGIELEKYGELLEVTAETEKQRKEADRTLAEAMKILENYNPSTDY